MEEDLGNAFISSEELFLTNTLQYRVAEREASIATSSLHLPISVASFMYPTNQRTPLTRDSVASLVLRFLRQTLL